MTPKQYEDMSDAERDAAAMREVEDHLSGRIPMKPLVSIDVSDIAAAPVPEDDDQSASTAHRKKSG